MIGNNNVFVRLDNNGANYFAQEKKIFSTQNNEEEFYVH